MWVGRSVASGLDRADLVSSLTQAYFCTFLFGRHWRLMALFGRMRVARHWRLMLLKGLSD